jgi:DNA-binding transcriptional LysR family regulator
MWLVSIGMGFAPTSLTTSRIRRPNVSYCPLPTNLPNVQTGMSWRKARVTLAVANFIAVIRPLAVKASKAKTT